MPFKVSVAEAAKDFPYLKIICALTPSSHKAAFHVQDSDGRDLCLKIVSPAYERDRLDREILAMQKVVHKNVVQLIEYTFSSKGGQQSHYLIEEFVEGKDLADHLEPGKPWTLARGVPFFAALCDGLGALRAQDIVHRDIKPENIRVRPDDTPVIVDFGLARHLLLPDLTQTIFGARLGTPAYFAPEQFEGTRHDIDHRTDIFAVGVLMYEAFTGIKPFWTDPKMTVGELRDAVCSGTKHLVTPQFLGLNKSLQLLISKMTEKDRARRPASADLVATILRKILAAEK